MLEYVAGNAVIGFAAANTYLAPVVGTDTASLFFTKDISDMSRGEVPPQPPDRILVQNGPGPAVSFNFDFTETNLIALNRAVFRFYVDTLATDPPAGFLRPTATNLSLLGVRSDTLSTLLTITSMNAGGWFDFDAALLRANLEAALNGTAEPFDRFEIRAQAISGASISPLILYDQTDPDKPPRAYLTLTRLQ
jgi:hypothetical protein